MKIRHSMPVLVLGTAVVFFGGTGSAQVTGSTPFSGSTPESTASKGEVKESGGLKDYLLRTIKISGSARARWEDTDGANFSLTPAESYVLTRIRLGIAFRPTPWLRFFAETQDARAEFYKSTPFSTVNDPFDFRQGYVEAGAIEGNGIKARFGRQDLILGSGRLISTGDWSNVTKTFDMIRGTITYTKFKVDLVAGSPLLYDPNREDRHKPGEHFYVAYGTLGKLLPRLSIEPYVMAKTQLNQKGKDGKLGDADTIYGGLRAIGTVRGGFDYNAEAVREGGNFGNDVIQSWGYVGGGGWTYSPVSWKPHLNFDYLWASGDSGLKDGHHQNFDSMYGSNQPLNSMTGQFNWRNISQWRAGVEFAPMKRLKVRVDFRDYWLATLQDGLYSASNVRTVFDAKATSSHVGEGIDSRFTYTVNPKMMLEFGVGNLSPGTYLKEAGKTTGFMYPWVAFCRTL